MSIRETINLYPPLRAWLIEQEDLTEATFDAVAACTFLSEMARDKAQEAKNGDGWMCFNPGAHIVVVIDFTDGRQRVAVFDMDTWTPAPERVQEAIA